MIELCVRACMCRQASKQADKQTGGQADKQATKKRRSSLRRSLRTLSLPILHACHRASNTIYCRRYPRDEPSDGLATLSTARHWYFVDPWKTTSLSMTYDVIREGSREWESEMETEMEKGAGIQLETLKVCGGR